jgi:hypothetical protein
VDAVFQYLLAGNLGAVCSYLDPAAQSFCLSGATSTTVGADSGSVTVRTAVIQGNEALVSVTGNLCGPGAPCIANTNPSLGMPTSPGQFQSSYQAAIAAGTSSSPGAGALSPQPCTKVGGKWYVVFG